MKPIISITGPSTSNTRSNVRARSTAGHGVPRLEGSAKTIRSPPPLVVDLYLVDLHHTVHRHLRINDSCFGDDCLCIDIPVVMSIHKHIVGLDYCY